MTTGNRTFFSFGRLIVVCVVVLAAFGAIVARLVHLQVVERSELVAEVERARKRVQTLSAVRGEIRDSNGNALATSRSIMEVGVDPQLVRVEDAAKLPQLARLLRVPLADVKAVFDRKTAASRDGRELREIRWVRLAESVDAMTYDQIVALDIHGVYGNRQFRRTYPGGSLAAHVIGFVNREGVAAMGVERQFDFYLRGQDGWRESERDGLRRELAQFRTREVSPTDGYNVVLSIDSFVQHCIETELREIVRRFNPVGATIIVSDPRDGFLLGLANYPTFDLNNFNKAELASQRNLAITDILEPGSTFKIVAASAALNEGLVTPEVSINCGADTIVYHGRTLRLPHDSHPNGMLSVADVIAKSSNRGAANLGVMLGADRLHDYAAAFGFGEATGFPLAGEVNGMLHPVRDWDGLTITRLPMGHAVGATPMQVHCAMSAIANGGILMRPQIVRRVVDRDGATVFELPPVARRRVIRKETAELMARLLTRVVGPDGTAEKAAIPGYLVAGKTGTTQKIIDGRYSNRHHVGSFTGFFPANRPRLAITVIIDDARLNGTAYGATVAAPSFKRIAEQLVQYLGIPPTEPVRAGVNLADNTAPHSSRRDRIR